jgi:hypothetical protein
LESAIIKALAVISEIKTRGAVNILGEKGLGRDPHTFASLAK